MNTPIRIRTANLDDQEAILRLRRHTILETRQENHSREALQYWANAGHADRWLERIRDRSVLVATNRHELVAVNSLDLDEQEMTGLFVHPARQGQGVGKQMVVEIERLAVQFGIFNLRVESTIPAVGFFSTCHYQSSPGCQLIRDPRTGLDTLGMERAFPQRQTRYGARIRNILRAVGIREDYGRRHRLMLQEECRELATIGFDVYDREQMLLPEAAQAWHAMRACADSEGIDLQIASAFRSVDYQLGIIERKLSRGQAMDEILRVSAAPGFSEHHTGRAVDITTSGCEPLETAFETTPAFEWLTESAQTFGFRLSFPRHNRHGIAYEPWHWAWTKA